MTAIMAMPTSTQLARTEPTTMPIEIPFDDEPTYEIGPSLHMGSR